MNWALDPTGLIVGLVHFQVNVRGGPEILRGSVDRCIIRKNADVFVQLILGRSGTAVYVGLGLPG